MALNLLSMFGVASGLLDIFGGTKKKKDNSKIANAQEKLVRQRYEFNKKESNEALEENLRNTYSAYATTRLNVLNSVKDEVSKINTYASQAQNIELEASSMMFDTLNNLDYDFNNTMQDLYKNQDNSLKGLVRENTNLNYQLLNNLGDTITGIKTNLAQQNAAADQDIMNGIIGVGSSALNMWSSRKSGKSSLENIKNESFGNYLNSNFSSLLYPQYQNPNTILNSINRTNLYLNSMFSGGNYNGR